jgi:hypothetical protein
MDEHIRLIGGAWRVIDGQKVKSYATYEDALADKSPIESQEPHMTTDDIKQQMFGGNPLVEKKARR